MKVWITGPIENAPAFESTAARLWALGFDVVDHFDTAERMQEDDSWLDFMTADIRVMLGCDAVFVLVGWEESREACIEVDLANALGIPVFMSADALFIYNHKPS
jgi:hypothetical protein